MRKVTQATVNAMIAGNNVSIGNTSVSSDGNVMSLHGNTIAIYNREDNLITLRDSGWCSNTTKERLNGILSLFNIPWTIKQENFTWLLVHDDGRKESWDGFIVVKAGI